jgi:hypothetical protein
MQLHAWYLVQLLESLSFNIHLIVLRYTGRMHCYLLQTSYSSSLFVNGNPCSLPLRALEEERVRIVVAVVGELDARVRDVELDRGGGVGAAARSPHCVLVDIDLGDT